MHRYAALLTGMSGPRLTRSEFIADRQVLPSGKLNQKAKSLDGISHIHKAVILGINRSSAFDDN